MLLQPSLILMFLALSCNFAFAWKYKHQIQLQKQGIWPFFFLINVSMLALKALNSTLRTSDPPWQQFETKSMSLEDFYAPFSNWSIMLSYSFHSRNHHQFQLTSTNVCVFFFLNHMMERKNTDLCPQTRLQPTSKAHQRLFDRWQIFLWNPSSSPIVSMKC